MRSTSRGHQNEDGAWDLIACDGIEPNAVATCCFVKAQIDELSDSDSDLD